MTFSWHKRDHHQMIVAGESLSLEESGALSRLIDFTFDRGAWPKNEARPTRHWLGASPQKWNILREGLVEKGFLVVCEGNLTIPLVEPIFKEFLKNQQECHDRASRDGLNSELKRKKPNENNENRSTEGEGEGEQESESDSPLSDVEIFRQKLVRHLDSKPKTPGKELKQWVWADGVQILMVTAGLYKMNARSRIASLLNSHDENAASVAQILCQKAHEFIGDPDQTVGGNISAVSAVSFNAEVPIEYALNADSEAGKQFAKKHLKDHGQLPQQDDGSYLVDKRTFSEVARNSQRGENI